MLRLFAFLYGKIIELRNALFDKGVFATHDLGARVISIGNLTSGGTGKTPLVAYIAEVLSARCEKVCILTRGYGREKPKQRVLVSDGEKVLADARTGGDEPVELAQKLLGKAIVIADRDRVSAAAWALRKFGVTVFLLDDGFQHRKVERDLDIVCIDATNPFGGGTMLPAGGLRERVKNLARADVIVITRADLVNDISNLKFEIAESAPKVNVFTAAGKLVNAGQFHGQRAFAFCAIGNPESFFEQLRRSNVNLVGTRSYADHHYYSESDVRNIDASAASSGAELLLTTAKDAVKISHLKFQRPCLVVDIRLEPDDPDGFDTLVAGGA